ncbi:hypothetical protein SISNIDRAFT_480601 [Sistotremastrum niveocremeum HHB9708]|uniref:Uncharacterized protein n=1 Tax=Sistotremastrum niveocremeum HHB9708 TaxID=1314777 RepID=A0A165AHS4_9AGAM|nr:hypothetical protein SISNIDRAFT_480601 [Sistotremastrum niveocremeum HHB9708]
MPFLVDLPKALDQWGTEQGWTADPSINDGHHKWEMTDEGYRYVGEGGSDLLFTVVQIARARCSPDGDYFPASPYNKDDQITRLRYTLDAIQPADPRLAPIFTQTKSNLEKAMNAFLATYKNVTVGSVITRGPAGPEFRLTKKMFHLRETEVVTYLEDLMNPKSRASSVDLESATVTSTIDETSVDDLTENWPFTHEKLKDALPQYKLKYNVDPFPLFIYDMSSSMPVSNTEPASSSTNEWIEPDTKPIGPLQVQREIQNTIVKIYFTLKAWYIKDDNKVQFSADIVSTTIIFRPDQSTSNKRRLDKPPTTPSKKSRNQA